MKCPECGGELGLEETHTVFPLPADGRIGEDSFDSVDSFVWCEGCELRYDFGWLFENGGLVGIKVEFDREIGSRR